MTVLVLVVAVVAAGAGAQAPTAKAPALTVVLDTSGFWRVHHTLAPPVLRDEAGKTSKLETNCKTEGPAKDWQQADFDDSGWARLPGAPFPDINSDWAQVTRAHTGFVASDDSSPGLAMICMRGKFSVTDPSAIKNLRLDVDFRGGAAVYVNGKLLTSKALGDGASGPDDLAEDYPLEAFVGPDDKVLDADRSKKPDEIVRRWSLRTRKIEGVEIPAGMLRKGVNVLAVELHRAAYPAKMVEWVKSYPRHSQLQPLWSTVGLTRVQLLADSGEGLVPNATRPTGVQLWNSPLMSNDYDLDWGDPNEPLRPIQIVGARNGSFSGKVVIGSDQPIKAISAKVSDLRSADGASISASAVKVRWALANSTDSGSGGRYSASPTWFDGLSEEAPAEVAVAKKPKGRGTWDRPNQPQPVFGAVQPIWLTVAVPADAKAGLYRGQVTISMEGSGPHVVPIELTVTPFALQPASRWQTVVDFVQSPDSVAMQYDVEPYSEAHFKLLAESLERLGEVGNWSVYVPLVAQTNLGHRQTMVRWVRQADGSYKHDFMPMEKYLDLAIEKMGKPRIVVLYAWDIFLGRVPSGGTEAKGAGAPVSVVDEQGNVSLVELPAYDDPASYKMWQELADGAMKVLEKRGLKDAAVLGLVPDGAPSKSVVEVMAKLFPDVPWMRHAHSSRKDVSGGPLKWQFMVWTPRFAAKPEDFGQGWKETNYSAQFCRSQSVYPSTIARLLGEFNIQGHQRGFGRIGLDFWPVLKDARGRASGTLQASDPRSSWANLDWMTKAFVAAGPAGALASSRLEMMREGLQETEARILIEKALADEKQVSAMGAELASRCRALLLARNKANMMALDNHFLCGFGQSSLNNHGWWSNHGQVGRMWFIGSGYQQRAQELYALAAQVQAKSAAVGE